MTSYRTSEVVSASSYRDKCKLSHIKIGWDLGIVHIHLVACFSCEDGSHSFLEDRRCLDSRVLSRQSISFFPVGEQSYSKITSQNYQPL